VKRGASLLGMVNHALSPAGKRARLAIMIFHRVRRERDPLAPYEPDAATFEARMRAVRRWFNVLPLEHAVERLATRTLPSRALAITFDDGYADNVDVALPILSRLGLHATFFIATGFLDGGCMWNDRVIEAVRGHKAGTLDLSPIGLPAVATGSIDERRAAIDRIIDRLKYQPLAVRAELAERVLAAAGAVAPLDLMMTSAQVRALAEAGMGIGAHTHMHPILAQLDPRDAQQEIETGKRALEAIVGRPVRLFAYPNGKPRRDYTHEHVRQARQAGFVAACSTAHGVAGPQADPLQLPRFTPWDREQWRFGARLSGNLMHARCETA
jgi:peptidoglycan/xylan/chitin deacetylase (PgdA/CDA1 family)